MDWSYGCPSLGSAAALAEFALAVYKGRHWDLGNPGASSSRNQGSGVLHYSDTGAFSLFVTSSSMCTWTVRVILPNG